MSRFRVPGSMLVLKDMSEKYCYIHCQFKMILHSDMSDVFDTRCASVFGLHLYNGSCDLGTSATARPLAITARICLHIGMISSSVALSGKSMTSTTGGIIFLFTYDGAVASRPLLIHSIIFSSALDVSCI